MQDIVIRIKGDSSDIVKLGDELKKLGKVDEDNAKQFKKNNDDFKKATKEQSSSIKSLTGDLTDIKGQLLNIGKNLLAAFAVEQVIEFGKESVKAFMEAELNAKKLNTAITTIGGEGQQSFQKLIKQSEELQKKGIFSDDAIQQSQTQLAQFGLVSTEIEQLIPLIADMASATGMDLGQATDTVIQGINGMTRGLKPLGLEFKNTGDKAQNYQILVEKLGKYQGQMDAVMETSSGKLTNMQNAWDDAKEAIGGYIMNLTVGPPKQFSEQLVDQQSKLNSLVLAITNTNEKTEERKKLINSLIQQYPDFLSGLNKEKVSNEQLLTKLQAVNNQYAMKISLARFDEKNADIMADQADASIRLNEATSRLNAEIFKRVKLEDLLFYAKQQNVSPKDLWGLAKLTAVYGDQKRDMQGLIDAQTEYAKASKEFTSTTTEANKVQAQRISFINMLQKQYNVSLEETKTVTSNLGKTDDVTSDKSNKNKEKQLSAIEKLRATVQQLSKDLENEAVTTGISEETTNKYIEAKKQLTEVETEVKIAMGESANAFNELQNEIAKIVVEMQNEALYGEINVDLIKRLTEAKQQLKDAEDRVKKATGESTEETKKQNDILKESIKELEKARIDAETNATKKRGLEYQKAVKDTDEFYDELKLKAKDNTEAVKNIEEARSLEKLALLQNFVKEEQKIELDIAKDTADKKQKIWDNTYKGLQELGKVFANINQIANNNELSLIQENNQEKIKNTEEYYNALIQQAGSNTELVAQYEKQKADNINAINQELADKEKELKKRQFKQDKEISIFETIINTAEAVVKSFADGGPILATLAGIVGATQLGIILSQPEPYAKGTEFLKRGKNPVGVDTIPIMANEGEAIIPTEKNAERPGLAKAWIKGTLDDYININYIIPALNQRNKKQTFADNIAKAIQLNSGFNDANLLESDKMNRKLLMEQNKLLKKIANGSVKNPYRF